MPDFGDFQVLIGLASRLQGLGHELGLVRIDDGVIKAVNEQHRRDRPWRALDVDVDALGLIDKVLYF